MLTYLVLEEDGTTQLQLEEGTGVLIAEEIPNDNFAGAITLSTTLPNSVEGTTRGATTEGSEDAITSGTPQSVWYKFTPTITGKYRFRIDGSQLEYNGVSAPSNGACWLAISDTTTMADFLENVVSDDFNYNGINLPQFDDPRGSGGLSATLTASTTYYIRVWSHNTGTANQRTCDFRLSYDLLVEAANNDFANRITLSGASGSEDFSVPLGDMEASEPLPWYNWEDAESDVTTSWFEWTCPSSGWYEFYVEYDEWVDWHEALLAIYTGAAVNALTAVAKNSGGSYGNDPGYNRTTIRFNATNGVNYKIQVGAWKGSIYTASNGTIAWATASTPANDLTTTAPDGVFGVTRVHNFGATDDELPPNAVTLLSPHGYWNYNDGAVGRSVWWKYDAPGAGTVRVSAIRYEDALGAGREYALLVYKGADFASLTIAQTENAEDAVMMHGDLLARTLDDETTMDITFTGSDIVWICLVGTYDRDYDNDTVALTIPESCPQVDVDLQFEQLAGDFLDAATVYINIEASGLDVGPLSDSATILVDLQHSGFEGDQYIDSETVYLDLQVLGGECFSRFHFTGEGEADPRWSSESDLCRWSGDDQVRWTSIIESQPGC